jgi:hypothetical protein
MKILAISNILIANIVNKILTNEKKRVDAVAPTEYINELQPELQTL